MKKNEFIQRIVDATGADEKMVMDRFESMNFDEIMTAISAVSSHDDERIKEAFASLVEESEMCVAGDVEYLTMDRIKALAGVSAVVDYEQQPSPYHEVEFEQNLGMNDILQSLDKFERSIYDLKFTDAKAVRKKLSDLCNRLNENAAVRKRK
jgi:hypothetical protein